MKESIVKRTVSAILAAVIALFCGTAAFAGIVAESTTEAIPPVISGFSGNLGFWLGIALFILGAAVAAAFIFVKVKRDNGEQV